MHIESSHTNIAYPVLYLITFLMVYVRLLWIGYKNSIPMVSVIVATALCFTGFSFGSRVIFMETIDWTNLLNGHIIEIHGRSVIGGMFGALAGIVAGNFLLNVPSKITNQFGLMLPLGIAIMRIGCFLSGCCYGRPSTLPWAIHYSESLASIHPVQLYEVIGCLILFYIVYRSRCKFKNPFSLLLFSGILYGILRFISEFFRDTLAPVTPEEMTWYVNGVQRFLLILIPALWLIILRWERYSNKNKYYSENRYRKGERELSPSFFTLSGTLIGLTLINIFLSIILTPLDFLVIFITIVPAWACFIISGYKKSILFSRHPIIAIVFIGALLSMAQTNDTTIVNRPEKKSFNTVNIGFFHGSHDFTDVATYGGDCNGGAIPITSSFEEKYTAGGAGFSRTIVKNEFKRITYGMDAMVGSWTEKGTNNLNTDRTLTYYDANPYVKFDDKVIGVGMGLHIGDLPILNNTYNAGEATLITRYRVYPQFNFRIGRKDKFFGEIHYADAGYGSFPGALWQIGFGSGFGHMDKHSLEVGTSSFSGFYIAPRFLLARQYYINPYFGTGSGMFTDYDDESNTQAGMRISYRF